MFLLCNVYQSSVHMAIRDPVKRYVSRYMFVSMCGYVGDSRKPLFPYLVTYHPFFSEPQFFSEKYLFQYTKTENFHLHVSITYKHDYKYLFLNKKDNLSPSPTFVHIKFSRIFFTFYLTNTDISTIFERSRCSLL